MGYGREESGRGWESEEMRVELVWVQKSWCRIGIEVELFVDEEIRYQEIVSIMDEAWGWGPKLPFLGERGKEGQTYYHHRQ